MTPIRFDLQVELRRIFVKGRHFLILSDSVIDAFHCFIKTRRDAGRDAGRGHGETRRQPIGEIRGDTRRDTGRGEGSAVQAFHRHMWRSFYCLHSVGERQNSAIAPATWRLRNAKECRKNTGAERMKWRRGGAEDRSAHMAGKRLKSRTNDERHAARATRITKKPGKDDARMKTDF